MAKVFLNAPKAEAKCHTLEVKVIKVRMFLMEDNEVEAGHRVLVVKVNEVKVVVKVVTVVKVDSKTSLATDILMGKAMAEMGQFVN